MSIVPTTRMKRDAREVVSDLRDLESNNQFGRAIDMNIGFFRSIDNFFRLSKWLVFSVPRIRKEANQLLEIVDLPIAKWQEYGYSGLIKIEDNRFSRIMINDFVDELCRLISKIKTIKSQKKPLVIFDLGCGGGYLCREIITLNKNGPLVCVGVDNTEANIELAKKRFNTLCDKGEVIFHTIRNMNDNKIRDFHLEAERTSKSIFAIYYGDFFNLDKQISPGIIDMIFHSRVIHHLNLEERYLLVEVCRKLSFVSVEIEDIYSPIMPILAAFMTRGIDRNNYALLNGGVLSCIRDPGKEDLKGYIKKVSPNSYVRLLGGTQHLYENIFTSDPKNTLIEGFIYYD